MSIKDDYKMEQNHENTFNGVCLLVQEVWIAWRTDGCQSRFSDSLQNLPQPCISAPLTSNTVSTSPHRSTTKTTKSYSSHLFALHISFNKIFTNFHKFHSKKRKYHSFHFIFGIKARITSRQIQWESSKTGADCSMQSKWFTSIKQFALKCIPSKTIPKANN